MSNGIYIIVIHFEDNTLYLDVWSSRWREGERSCICVLGASGERSCICVLGVSILPLSTSFLLCFGTVPVVWHFILLCVILSNQMAAYHH
jgi:hypothetical protein